MSQSTKNLDKRSEFYRICLYCNTEFMADHMTRDVQVPDLLMSEITAKYEASHVVELVATVAAYNMVSRFLVALNISH